MKAYRGTISIVPIILTLGTRREWLTLRPGRFTTGKELQTVA